RQFQRRRLFYLFLDRQHLLLRVQLRSDHFLVFAQTCFHYITHRTLLLVALGDSCIDILVGQVILHFADELGDIAAAGSLRDGHETLDHESDDRQQCTDQDRYDDSTLIHTRETKFRALLLRPETAIGIRFREV